jgi:hypothetical protein
MKYIMSVRWWAIPALCFLALYFCMDAALWLLARHMHIKSFPPEVWAMLLRIHLTILCFSMGLYGLVRATCFHPAVQRGYRAWLRTSAWHPGMKLPLGPATLVWWDGIVLLAGAALAWWHLQQSLFLPLLTFGCAYVGCSLLPLAETFSWGAYMSAFGLAFVARCIDQPKIAVPIAAVLLLFTEYALRTSLRRFPWERERPADPLTRRGGLAIIPPDTKPLIPAHLAFAGSALLGAWLWAILSLNDLRARPLEVSLILCWLAMLGLLVRFGIYCGKFQPPLTLLGRLWTGRLIIAGYDYVMLAPALAVPLAILVPLALGAVGVSVALSVASTAAASLAVLLVAPPGLRHWQLTGMHRAVGFAAGQRVMRA